MKPDDGRMAADTTSKETPANAGETPFSARGSAGQAWPAADATRAKAAGSRGHAVLIERFPLRRPATADGPAARHAFQTGRLGPHTAGVGPARGGNPKGVRRVERGAPRGAPGRRWHAAW